MTHLTMKADDDDGLLVFNSWDPFFYLSFPAKMKGGLGLIAVKKKKKKNYRRGGAGFRVRNSDAPRLLPLILCPGIPKDTHP
jgi:hypothetical protein